MFKTILITGSNKGIGFETARQLGLKGHSIFISGRDEQRLKDAHDKLKSEKIDVHSLLMDVSDPKSISQAAELFGKQKLKLDVLINNAGIGVRNDRMISSDDEALLAQVLNTNAYGPLRVTKAFHPFMNSPARIINISSGGGSMTDPVGGWSPAYCVSKSMLNAITRHLAYELSSKKMAVNAVCPGWVRTDMGGKGAPRAVQQGAETPVWLAVEADQKLTGKFFRDKREIPW